MNVPTILEILPSNVIDFLRKTCEDPYTLASIFSNDNEGHHGCKNSSRSTKEEISRILIEWKFAEQVRNAVQKLDEKMAGPLDEALLNECISKIMEVPNQLKHWPKDALNWLRATIDKPQDIARTFAHDEKGSHGCKNANYATKQQII